MPTARTVTAESPLLPYLFAAWPEAKRKTVRDWLQRGQVVVNGKPIRQFDHALRPGDTIAIRSEVFAETGTTLDGGLRIVHEDTAVIVIEKPPGMLSIAAEGELHRTAYALLTEHVRRGRPKSRERVWIVHRLDRETSGLMVFARTEAAKRTLQQGWEAVEKKYWAVVEGAPPAVTGVLEAHLDESDSFRVRVVPEGIGTRLARTRYRAEKSSATCTLLEVTLETGRRHQIRVQLAHAGCPIVGDKRYGATTDPARRVALHACALRFPLPTDGKPLRFVSPLPGDLGRLVA